MSVLSYLYVSCMLFIALCCIYAGWIVMIGFAGRFMTQCLFDSLLSSSLFLSISM